MPSCGGAVTQIIQPGVWVRFIIVPIHTSLFIGQLSRCVRCVERFAKETGFIDSINKKLFGVDAENVLSKRILFLIAVVSFLGSIPYSTFSSQSSSPAHSSVFIEVKCKRWCAVCGEDKLICTMLKNKNKRVLITNGNKKWSYDRSDPPNVCFPNLQLFSWGNNSPRRLRFRPYRIFKNSASK